MDDLSTPATEGFGLMFYNARIYDPALGRFTSADTIIPQSQGVQAWDRYAYTNNNPIRYNDPSGHCSQCGVEVDFGFRLAAILFSNASQATQQSFGLVVNWFFQTGKEEQIFEPTAPITQEVMEQEGVDDFYEAWKESGYADEFTAPTTIDDRTLPLIPRLVEWGDVLVQSHLIDLPLALMGDEDHSAIPGTIGSLDEITATYTDDGQVMMEVHNTMGLASGTRISTWSLLPNRDRSEGWFGGTTEQYFYWYVDAPNAPKNKEGLQWE